MVKLPLTNKFFIEDESDDVAIHKPSPGDAIQQREKYIFSKYVEKRFVETTTNGTPSYATRIWEAVKSNNIQEVYRLIATSHENIINTTYDDVAPSELIHNIESSKDSDASEKHDPKLCKRIKDSKRQESCLQGCTLLHLACDSGYQVMVELLLQFGADTNRPDYHGRTPLHHCIFCGHHKLAKYILRRGAVTSIKDGSGQGALERAMEMGAITDDELLIFLSDGK